MKSGMGGKKIYIKVVWLYLEDEEWSEGKVYISDNYEIKDPSKTKDTKMEG